MTTTQLKNMVVKKISKIDDPKFLITINNIIESTKSKNDVFELNDFQKRIDYFFSLYASEDEEFREFIKLISLYLTFIAKKPLHPSGIKFSEGKGVYKEQNIYYCTAKSEFINDKMSLCKYCVCNE